MTPSGQCLALIREFEGVRYKVYADTGGKATIGIGHLLTTKELSTGMVLLGDKQLPYTEGLTKDAVEELFAQDINKICDSVRRCVGVDLNQGQFDALVSFVFNIGEGRFKSSTMCRLINNRDFLNAVEQFKLWVNVAGIPVNGLIRRRKAEAELFRGNLHVEPTITGSYTDH